MKKQKVLLAMSGGVDSSVAALLLKKQGYDVTGIFMKNWSDTKDPLTGKCSWRTERKFAIQIASKLNIPLITVDSERQYKKQVIEKMFEKYQKGITPNPDIECNQKIKFPLLIQEAKKLKINSIATGHYARKKFNNKTKKYELLRAKDESKDQSYFLYKIKQSELKNCLFPVGNLTKKQVRKIAEENKFPNYNKKGTVGICFIGKINFKEFLKKKIKPKKGKILDPEGNVIGEHNGAFYYTIGERLGPRYGFEISRNNIDGKKNPNDKLTIQKQIRDAKRAQSSLKGAEVGDAAANQKIQRWYVAEKDVKKNVLVAAPKNHALNFRKEIIVKNFYLISERKNKFKKAKTKVFSRIRHVGELLPSILKYQNKKYKVILKKSITGISEGQAIVLYQKDKCIGGGEIGFN